jgi:ABC-type multidrug transport system fused ATPase/permease subunit
MALGITRLGPCEGSSRVQWSTFDMSAKAGTDYEAVEPTWVEFKDGETHVEVHVKVLHCTALDGTPELGLSLDPTSVQGGAQVGKYLHTSTLKIMDTNYFPQDALQDWVEGGNPEHIAKIAPFTLIWSFIKLCWANDTARSGALKIATAHQYFSCVQILNIFIMLYVVSTLTNIADETKTERVESIVLYGVLWIVPLIGCHVLTYRRQFWNVGGSLKKMLRMLLLKKVCSRLPFTTVYQSCLLLLLLLPIQFLNYTDDSRNKVAIEALVMALIRDVTAAVSDGFVTAIDLIFGTLFKIVYMVTAMIYLHAISDSGMDPKSIVAVFLLPIFIGVFICARQKEVFLLRENQFAVENAGIGHVIKCVLNFSLISDYDRRTFMLDKFGKKIDASNAAATQSDAHDANSKYFAPWMTTLLVGSYLMWGGIEVIADEQDLPTFLSTIALFQALGGLFEEAHGKSLAITASYRPIAQLTMFMNLPIDVPNRLHLTSKRCNVGKEMRNADRLRLASGEGPPLAPSDVSVDRLPLIMKNVTFFYHTSVALQQKVLTPPSKVEPSSRLNAKQLPTASAVEVVTGDKEEEEEFTVDEELRRASLEPIVVSVDAKSEVGDVELGDVDIADVPEEEAQELIDTFLVKNVRKTHLEILRRPSDAESAALKLQGTFRSHLAKKEFTHKLVSSTGGLRNLNLVMAQGQMVAVTGASSQGKATILRLLASQIFHVNNDREGTDNLLFVPPHLRVVSEPPLFWPKRFFLGGNS